MKNLRTELRIAGALLIGAWVVRLAVAAQLNFPPLDDPAFYVQTARHLASGRGLITDVLWTYQFPFAGVTHASHEYWMPLATLLMAPWIKVLGDSLFVAQLPGTLCGALLVPLTYALGRMALPERRRSAVAASLLVLGAALPVYQSASTDSAAPFALAAAGALMAGARAEEKGSPLWGLGAGILAGFAYLARADGLLIPVVIGLWFVLRRTGWRMSVALLGSLAVGFGLPVVPWWARNLSAFGVVQPISPSIGGLLQDYAQLFNWDAPPTFGALLARGLPFVAGLRLEALWHNLGVWALVAFPFGLYGWMGCLRRSTPALRLGLAYGTLLFLASALIYSIPTQAGLFYHSAGAIVPWLAVGAVHVVEGVGRRRRSLGAAAALLTVSLLVSQAALAWPAVIKDAHRNALNFAEASEWLDQNASPREPVVASQAHSLNYASGRPSLSLPAGQGLQSVRALARAYGARYVVVTESFGRYPQELDGRLGSDVRLRLETPGVRIYELLGLP